MNNFKELTDQIYSLYKSFIESGFTDYQAYELTEAYTRQSIADIMLVPKKRTRREVYREEDYYNLTSDRRKNSENNKDDRNE